MKAISSAIFSMSEQQAVFEQENSCREARPWQEKREKEPRIGETVYPEERDCRATLPSEIV